MNTVQCHSTETEGLELKFLGRKERKREELATYVMYIQTDSTLNKDKLKAVFGYSHTTKSNLRALSFQWIQTHHQRKTKTPLGHHTTWPK